jgi:K+-transporting ATPase A subunit
MDQQQFQQFVRDYWPYILAANFVIGVLLGLIPFFLGRKKGKATLGLIALIVTTIVCIPSTLFGIFSAVAFSIVILIRGRSVNGGSDGE